MFENLFTDIRIVALVLVSVLLLSAGGCLSPNNEDWDVRMDLEIGSVFHNGDFIPVEFTCDGENVNPPIFIGHIDSRAKSLVISPTNGRSRCPNPRRPRSE